MPPAISPSINNKDRIIVIDIIRGVAVCGILLMNISYYANPDEYDNPLVRNETSGANFYSWLVIEGFFTGSMRAVFSIIFGATTVMLFSKWPKMRNLFSVESISYRRLIWLFVFGLINAFVFLWQGDILYQYALCGLLVLPVSKLTAKQLLIISIILLTLATALDTYHWYSLKQARIHGEYALALENQQIILNKDQVSAKDKWLHIKERREIETLRQIANEKIKIKQNGSYPELISYGLSHASPAESNKFYQVLLFDIIICIVLGMALFKLNFLSGGKPDSIYIRLLLICYVTGIAIGYWQTKNLVNADFDKTRLFDIEFVNLINVRRILIGLGHIWLIILLYKKKMFNRLMTWLSKTGQMAFTNYLLQSIICGLIFYGYGLGLFGKLQRHEQFYIVILTWIFQIMISNLWLRYFWFGPFEWLWRSLTYWKRQPMRK